MEGPLFNDSLWGYRLMLKGLWFQQVLRFNKHVPWPISPSFFISNPKNIFFDPGDLNNFQSPGCYFQNFSASIYLGKGSYIGPNVGLITANHDPRNLVFHHEGKDIHVGERCWIGMNSVVLPGVRLANGVVVAAGSVVTRDVEIENCLVAGVPAKIVKRY